MLYNPKLETFLCAADAGSFSRAAAELFITSTAVIKRITLLEEELGVPLFTRTHSGISLTDAGKSLSQSGRALIRLSREAAEDAKNAMESDEAVIRIGTSPLTPTDAFFRLWPDLYASCPDLKFQLIPYENTLESAQKVLENLGTNMDIVAGVFDDELLKIRHCDGLVLSYAPICVAVSPTHPLAERKFLSVHDLYGETLLLMKQGWCDSVDLMREELQRNHPQIRIKSFDFYNVDIFNRCETGTEVLMAIDNWASVHPLLKLIPVDWNYTIPFGLFHAHNPSKTVRRFLNVIRRLSLK